MSFTFEFVGDDIDDEGDAIENVADGGHQTQPTQLPLRPPQPLDFRETLATMPSQISYNALSIGLDLTIYRRSLFDIRAQLMAEADVGNNNDDLLAGLDAGDLTSGVYEGGLKTWECAVDLAEYVVSTELEGNWHIVELGAGSAIPSCALLQQVIRRHDPASASRLHFTLCDYNEDVLKLCTAPNVFLNLNQAVHHPGDQAAAELDVDLEEIDTSLLVDELESRGITLSMISGAWGSKLGQLATSSLPPGESWNVMILASETIYSPESLNSFNDALIHFLQSSPSAIALIAAKQIYFGVGGGVGEFTNDICKRGAVIRTVAQASTVGVGRVILEVKLAAKPV